MATTRTEEEHDRWDPSKFHPPAVGSVEHQSARESLPEFAAPAVAVTIREEERSLTAQSAISDKKEQVHGDSQQCAPVPALFASLFSYTCPKCNRDVNSNVSVLSSVDVAVLCNWCNQEGYARRRIVKMQEKEEYEVELLLADPSEFSMEASGSTASAAEIMPLDVSPHALRSVWRQPYKVKKQFLFFGRKTVVFELHGKDLELTNAWIVKARLRCKGEIVGKMDWSSNPVQMWKDAPFCFEMRA